MARSDAGLLKNALARDTLWVLLGQGGRAVLQAAYFVLVARSLGVQGFGAFAGVLAVVAAAAPFATLGMGHLLVRDVVRDRTAFPAAWGRALRVTLASGLALVVLTVGVARAILPDSIPTLLVLLLTTSDVLFARMVDLAGQAYQGCGRVDRMVAMQWVLSTTRLTGLVVVILVLSRPTPTQWAAVYLAATLLSAAIAVTLASRQLGTPDWRARASRTDFKDGGLFTVTVSAANVYNDIDKALLPRLATLEASGLYGAAYRVLNLAILPLSALLQASYARFFKHGADGVRGGLRLVRKLALAAMGYGIVASVALVLIAPVLPAILGQAYAGSVAAIRLLAVVPFFKAAQILSANTLTGAGAQRVRSLAQGAACLLNVGLNLWLIPLFSWRGAGIATLATECFLAVTLWLCVAWYHSAEMEQSPPLSPAAT